MGSPSDEAERSSDEGPQHKVTIAKPFAVGKFEVTFAEWDACVAAGGCKHKPERSRLGRGNRPVINVSWDDAKEYVPWLSGKTGKNLSAADRGGMGVCGAGWNGDTYSRLGETISDGPGELRWLLHVMVAAPRQSRRRPSRSVRSISQTLSVFMTCTAMSGSGLRIATRTTTRRTDRRLRHG